ncbi:MAG: polysaccharide biosynthesis protein [Lachnospiraceae bacterium]|nr:polysaccharide biosynthesis protein [Lachnospiraceae bacterium]
MSNQKKGKSDFLVQGSILAAASLISRIIGLIYRIPMTNTIGNAGNSYYSSAYEIYNILLLISAYSLPTAVSKLVSVRIARGQRKNAYRIVKGALLLACCTGLAASLILYFGAEALTELFRSPLSIYALKVLAPTVFVVAVLGVLRGFFQGLGTMMPSAFSQILEQIVNAVVSVVAAILLYGYGARIGAVLGDAEKYGSAYGAAGGTLGTNLGALAALLFIGLLFLGYKRVFRSRMARDVSDKTESYGTIIKILLLTIIPVLLSTTIYNISAIIDLGIYKNVAVAQGYDIDLLDDWWGIFTGKYKTIINIPIAIASAMATSCVPNLTAAYASRKKKAVRHQINVSIRFIMVIAFPCMVGVAVLASPILQLLYHDSSETSAKILCYGSIAILFYTLSTLSNGLLQGINRLREPVKNAAIALVLHIACLLVLMYGLDLNIYAVVYSNAFFSFCMCVLNAHSLKKYSGYRQEKLKTFVIPCFSSAVMGVAVYYSYHLLQNWLQRNAISTVAAIAAGILVYAVMMLLLRGLGEEEIRKFPKGAALVRGLKRLHLLR